MGCLTAKASGTVASFINPTVTDIESARVYFSPTQLGEGTPSPENVREIVGRTSVELYRNKKSIVPFLRDSISPTSHYNGFFNWSTAWKIPDRTKKYTYYVYIDNTKGTQSATAKLWFRNEDNSAYVGNKASMSVNVGKSKWVSVVATIDENSYYICFGLDIYAGTTAKYPMVFEGNGNQTETIPFSWKRLPDEYQEVEYIESTGTQYIKTNISTNDLISVDLLAQFTESSDASQVLFSASTNGPNWFGQRDNVYACGASSVQKSTVDSTQKSKIHIVFNSNSIICAIGDNTFSRSDSSQHQNGQLYKLFNTDYPSKAKIFNCIIYNDDITIANLVPCYRKSDNEIGMYDTVSQTFYTNQGTGTFTKGDDVFSNEVYGGYVDLIKGELVEEYKRIRLDANTPSEFAIQSNGLYTIWRYIDGMALSNTNEFFNDTKILCNSIQKVLSRGSIPTTQLGILFGNNSNNIYLYNMNSVYGYTTKEQISAWLDENPIYVTVPLATPITHSLPDYLKIQLQTLKNENTFWSDADSVEIEYGLAETFDIQKAKRKIIMNQPHVESASNSPSSPQVIKFKTDMKAPLKQCIVNFAPIQEGSGDPSPTNVRNITGWTEISVKNGENTYTVDWTDDVGTVYGGYVDLVSGELVAEYFGFTADGENIKANTGYVKSTCYGAGLVYLNGSYNFPDGDRVVSNTYCDTLNPSMREAINCVYWTTNSSYYVVFYVFSKTAEETKTTAEAKNETNEWLKQHPTTVVYKMKEPITYQLTPQQILTFKLQQNIIWNSANEYTDIKYWTRKPFRKINDYLTIVEWTDKKFISATGKITAGDDSASYTTDAIFLKAGTYNLNGFNSYTGKNITYRIHEYTQTDEWVKQVAYFSISKNSEVDVSFTLDHDSYIRLSMARLYFTGTLTKVF